MTEWERRRDDPVATWNRPRHGRGQKDRRRWCRGKVGVEHKPTVVLDSWLGRTCGLSKVGKWEQYRTYKSWVIIGTEWRCHHIEQCINCGKKLRHLAGEECPIKRSQS